MKSRWLIRGFFVALCVIWVGSYLPSMEILYVEKAGNFRDSFVISEGRLMLARMDVTPIEPSRFRVYFGPGVASWWEGSWGTAKYGFLGFGVGRAYYPGSFITIPFWCPTLSLLFWLIWQKRRAKYDGKAFPVEQTPRQSE